MHDEDITSVNNSTQNHMLQLLRKFIDLLTPLLIIISCIICAKQLTNFKVDCIVTSHFFMTISFNFFFNHETSLAWFVEYAEIKVSVRSILLTNGIQKRKKSLIKNCNLLKVLRKKKLNLICFLNNTHKLFLDWLLFFLTISIWSEKTGYEMNIHLFKWKQWCKKPVEW